jgi:hydrogenase expression/formation protein HypD
VDSLVQQIESNQPKVDIAYRRGVKPEGNPAALRLMEEVFETGDANWRGIGTVPGSGLQLKAKYEKFDADKHFSISTEPAREPKGCICGSILRGVSTPLECTLFSRACTPESPVGPCMVSSEGSCATYYHYEGKIV